LLVYNGLSLPIPVGQTANRPRTSVTRAAPACTQPHSVGLAPHL